MMIIEVVFLCASLLKKIKDKKQYIVRVLNIFYESIGINCTGKLFSVPIVSYLLVILSNEFHMLYSIFS